MTLHVKETVIRAIGNSAGITIPKSMLEKMQVAEGDAVYLVEKDGGVMVLPHDPQFERVMEAYRHGARKYRNALKVLAGK
jgi:putative addiction module antidote